MIFELSREALLAMASLPRQFEICDVLTENRKQKTDRALPKTYRT
jgi:hypothetical protein